jgi:hypothetical protein
MPESHHVEAVEVVERPMSISRLVHTLRAYTPAIVLAAAAVAVVYVVLAVAAYILAPSQRVTSQKFRLEFEGAAEGRYPNGTKFASSDIISTPILLRVFNENHLDQFTGFPQFSRAVFVLESNPDYERLSAEYQSRLADPRLSAIDRERIQREWQSKAASLAKNDFSLSWLRTRDTGNVPDTVVKKALLDILRDWARFAETEEHVLKYRLTVLSPDVVNTDVEANEPIIAIQMLRSKCYKFLQNIEDLRQAPSSELRRTADGMSLEEIRLRLEEIVRFRLEPLNSRVAAAGLVADRAGAVRFLQTQLAYDQRKLKATQDSAEAIRQALAVYSLEQHGFSDAQAVAGAVPRGGVTPGNAQRPADTVMPQINDTFLDRIMALTSQSNDVIYRQRLVDDYRRAAGQVIPAQTEVAYDQEVLDMVRNAGSVTPAANGVRNEIAATQADVRKMATRINEIYEAVSRNLNPAKELYTLTAPAVVHTERARSLQQLALYGLVVMAVAIPIIIVLCLLHARIREEEASEHYVPVREAEARV